MAENDAPQETVAEREVAGWIVTLIGGTIAILAAVAVVGSITWGVWALHESDVHDQKTVTAHLESRYGATPIGPLYWDGDGGDDKTMISFDDSKIRQCMVAGNSYDDPILVCSGNEPKRIG